MEVIHQSGRNSAGQAPNQNSRLQRAAGQRARHAFLAALRDAPNVLLDVGGDNGGRTVAIGTPEIPFVINLVVQAEDSKVLVADVWHSTCEKRSSQRRVTCRGGTP